jgi:type IV pilus assembly protein PilY1
MPSCSNNTTTDERSRWATVVEVLTGSFDNFTCEHQDRTGEETGYYIPHVAFPHSGGAALVQASDGLLDTYSERIEFGLMTMDSFSSPASDSLGMWSYPTPADPAAHWHIDLSGNRGIQWNQAGDPTCQYFWNVGARRPWDEASGEAVIPGALVAHDMALAAWGDPIYQTRNAYIQSQLLDAALRPYWSSPVAAMLADARYYWGHHPGLAPPIVAGGTGDCYARCRDRHVILITDGLPNTDGFDECNYFSGDYGAASAPGDGDCPYRRAWEEAYDLYLDGVQVHVVGFNAVDDSAEPRRLEYEGITGVSEPMIETLGRWGWGKLSSNCPEDLDGNRQCVLYADDATQLREAVAQILEDVVAASTSQTRTATVNAVVNSAMGQHQFFSSMEVTSGGAWEGNLERVDYQCVYDNTAQEWNVELTSEMQTNGPYDYGDDGLDLLTIPAGNYTTRKLYTVDPDRDLAPHAAGALPLDFDPLHDATSISNAELGGISSTERAELLNWMHGTNGTVRRDRRLGAIYHSTPAIIGPPSLELALASYNAGPHISAGKNYDVGFRQLYGRRPRIIYTATLDGILHAFFVNPDESPNRGNPELWGFVPPMLLPLINQQRLGQMFLLDGQILVRDIRFGKDAEGTETDEWATVLVMGLRHGGGVHGYFALDVTAPYPGAAEPTPGTGGGAMGMPADPSSGYGEPTLLWQITDTTNTNPVRSSAEPLAVFNNLGYAYARPTFGTVAMSEGGGINETAVVFLPAGMRPPSATTLNEEQRAVGCGLFVVSARDGRLIRWLYPENGDADDGGPGCRVEGGRAVCDYSTAAGNQPSNEFDCQFVGTPLALGGLPGDVTTRVFLGDRQGRLYRANVQDPDPGKWTVELFVDLYNRDDETAALSDPNRARQPIFDAPAAAFDEQGLVTLVFGTGDSTDLPSRAQNRLASVTEGFKFNDADSGVVGQRQTCAVHWGQATDTTRWGGPPIDRPWFCVSSGSLAARVYPWVNWVAALDTGETPGSANLTGTDDDRPFQPGERLMGSPVIFNEVAYFATFYPSTDETDCCQPGSGRVLGVHYIGDQYIANKRDNVLLSRDDTSLSLEVLNLDVSDEESEIAFGVSIVRQPSCMEIDASSYDYAPRLETASQAEYRLVVHDNSTPPDTGPDSDLQTGHSEVELPPPPRQCRPDTWVSIFGV